MHIVIMSRGRADRVKTLLFLNKVEHPVTILCPDEEVEEYKRLNTCDVMGEGGTLNYSEKFNKLVNGHYTRFGRRIVIMDDDLRFCMRDPVPGSTKIVRATDDAVVEGLAALNTMLDVYPLAGLHARAMANTIPSGIKELTRINAIHAVNLDLIGPVKVDQWPILADIVLNLTLLTSGRKTAIWCDLFWDQVGTSNAPGGCSIHRTWEQQRDAVVGLGTLFPDYVKVVRKEVDKGWWGPDKPRYDFMVSWKKAYAKV